MIQPPERLLTARLSLRPVQATDAPVIYSRWTSHPGAMKFLPWKTHSTLDEAEAFVAGLMAQHERGEKYRYIAIDTGSAEPVGFLSLRIEEDCRVEIGFVVFPDSQGRGYAVEMIKTS